MLRVLSVNINGNAHVKVHDSNFKAVINNYDIICLSETGPETIGDLPGFKIIHTPRDDNSRNAGVDVLIKNSIADVCNVKHMHPQLCIMWLSMAIKGHEKVFLACCYLPPIF